MQIKTLKMSSNTTDDNDSASCYPSDYKTSQSDENNVVRKQLVQNLPGINLPEKILFVIDTVREKDCTPFKFSKGTNYMPLFMIKRVVEHFICIKSTIQRSHEYALMILNSQSADWICNFTSNIDTIIDSLDLISEQIIREEEQEQEQEEGEGEGVEELEEERKEDTEKVRRREAERERGGGGRGAGAGAGATAARQKGRGREKGEEEEKKEEEEQEDEKSYDLGQLFDKIEPRLPSSSSTNDIDIGPKFVTRVILLYSRSTSIPKFYSSKTSLDNLTKNPYFFVDVLYVHEPPCSDNLCEEIYSEIAKLDTKNVSYILEVGRNAAKLHDNMAKLLAHPLQRPAQKDVCYAIYRFPASQETYINV